MVLIKSTLGFALNDPWFFLGGNSSLYKLVSSPDGSGILFCYCACEILLWFRLLVRNDKKDIADSGKQLQIKNAEPLFDKVNKLLKKLLLNPQKFFCQFNHFWITGIFSVFVGEFYRRDPIAVVCLHAN